MKCWLATSRIADHGLDPRACALLKKALYERPSTATPSCSSRGLLRYGAAIEPPVQGLRRNEKFAEL